MSERASQAALREIARAKPGPREPQVSPDPSASPEHTEKDTSPLSAPGPPAKDTASYRRRVMLVLSAIVLALALYWASGYFFAYTDDAYVTSDLVSVAPYVSGRIVSLNIVDNQTVKKGELLATIDPTPFQLSLNEKQAKKAEAEAQLAVDRDVIAAAQAKRDDAAAKERLADDNLRRATPVAQAGFVSRQALETAATQAQEAKAALAEAEAAIAKAQQELALHQATVATITAEIAYCAMAARSDKVAGADRRHNQPTDASGRRPGRGKPTADRFGRRACLADLRQLQGKRDPAYESRSYRLGLARHLPVAYPSRDDPGHCARHQPGADASASCCPMSSRRPTGSGSSAAFR